jgi:argininosuccinate lyase
MSIARTKVAEGAMDPELFAWSSSFEDDRALVREDLLGSAAHATMLGRTEIIEPADARALRAALLRMLRESGPDGQALALAPEEDVHMAVEAHLGRSLGSLATRLHAARSRNDQVALDLRLHARDRAAEMTRAVARLARALAARARTETGTILPAYTHRQRAQPISAAFLLSAWAIGLLRAGDVMARAVTAANALPLGSGACSGTSLPIDRELVARLLAFPAITTNALDTVGDRDFLLDYAYAGARVLLALGKLSTDVIDFASNEFALVRLAGEISACSSMMPQKRNPDVLELTRASSGRALGDLTTLLVTIKGLPTGYNKDLQEDKRALFDAVDTLQLVLPAVAGALGDMTFLTARMHDALDGGLVATDVADYLVRKGVTFREAHAAVGSLIRTAESAGVELHELPLDSFTAAHAAFRADVVDALSPERSVERRNVEGGTGPEAVRHQLEAARAALAPPRETPRGNEWVVAVG